jgi:nuclear pore complex protein Nup88
VLFLIFFHMFSLARLFDLSSDVLQPEQEYYLQPVEPGRSRNAASICPVDFSFGGDHLWDRFSVSSVSGLVFNACA